ncbi:hypothetical protein PR003_g21310 [Phytophthora rubi]|uniref:Uncharacterized protein n=1 Tax=Phytophthora rubi TaxID=129364 RepID=A0A6A4DQT0_9STRA|nr:hypothetical protein PR003_g21310 [Phytophthora rubi]
MATPPFGSIALSGHSGVLMRRNLVAEPTEAATGSALGTSAKTVLFHRHLPDSYRLWPAVCGHSD